MKILIACEFSGIVREAFRLRGHDAWSCDLLPTEIPGQHYQGDVLDIIKDWSIIGGKPNILIGHPDCTFLCNSGVSWLHSENHIDRWKKMVLASVFFKLLWGLNIDKICLENPIPHKYAELPKYTQIIQPWQYGHPESKSTCLWLKNLPELKTTKIADWKRYRCKCGNIFEADLGKYGCCDYPAKPLWDNQTKSGQNKLPPSEHRAKDRSRTYPGIAEAMAEQWGR